MRLSNQLSIRRATRLIAALPFAPSREIRLPRFRRPTISRALRRPVSPQARERAAARRLYFTHLRRLVLILVVVFAGAASIKPALATITVREARYAAGVLVVRGETTRPLQRIGLDDRYFVRADESGRFLFRIQYLPHDCTVELGGENIHHIAFVDGCLP